MRVFLVNILPMYSGIVTNSFGLYLEYPILNATIVRMMLRPTTMDAVVIQIFGAPAGFDRFLGHE